MKKITALLLTAAILIGMLAGCGNEPEIVETEPSEPSGQIEAVSGAEELSSTEESPEAVFDGTLYINEVMPDNRLLVLGHENDWIELYNPGENAALLDGFYLTDDLEKPRAMSLAGLQIPAEGFLVVTLDSNSGFQLSEVGETVYLMRDGSVASELTFPAPENGESFDIEGVCAYPTPGQPNSEAGYLAYLEEFALPELIISEVVSTNSSHYGQDWVYYDLVEVKNNSNQTIDLGKYYLADRWENTRRFYFPDVTLEPGDFYVVLCSGDESLGDNHAPFKLSAEGQTLYLAREGLFVDALTIPGDLKSDESFGRSGKIPVYLKEVTIGAENSDGYLTGIAAPAVSLAPGVYDEAVTVELRGEGTIYYTLDGARPTQRSSVYKGPITIDDVTTIRAMCVSNDRTSSISNYTYVVGKEHEMPVLVISMPKGNRSSLLNNIEWNQEHEAVMTLFEDGEEKFTVPFGIRLHGNDSRKGAKKNFQLRFRSEYGAGKLEYRLFEDRDIDEFDSLLLKGGSEDYSEAMIRDELATYIVNGTTNLYTQAMKPVVVYLGGDYWGIHYLRERFSDEYVASHMDVSPESANILFSTAGYVQVGSNTDFTALKQYCKSNDMSTAENYAYLTERIDVTSLIDWYVCRTYFADRDLANCRRLKSDEGDGKWHWAFFDLDWSFYHVQKPITVLLSDVNGEHTLIHAVLESEAGRDAFLKRYAYLLRTILNEEYIGECMDYIISQIESEMPADRQRWQNSMWLWEYEVEQIRVFIQDETRHRVILDDIKDYLSLTDEQMQAYFGDLYYD